MKKTCALLGGLLFFALLPMQVAAAPALAIFSALPTTIFEETQAGLNETEKGLLIQYGESPNWEVLESEQDYLVLGSRGGDGTRVTMRVFRDGGGTLAAIGTDVDQLCSLELWRLGGRNRHTLVDQPPDARLEDFFRAGARPAPDMTMAQTFCVGPQGIEVRPLFWTSTGMSLPKVDNVVLYVWKDRKFVKRIIPRDVWDNMPEAGYSTGIDPAKPLPEFVPYVPPVLPDLPSKEEGRPEDTPQGRAKTSGLATPEISMDVSPRAEPQNLAPEAVPMPAPAPRDDANLPEVRLP